MIFCPRCGARANVKNIASVADSAVADALNVQGRTRECAAACAGSAVLHTTELLSSELAELRRQAYLWQRVVADEQRRQQRAT